MLNNPMMVVRFQVNPEYEEIFNEFYDMKVERFLKIIPEFQIGRRVVTERNGVKEYYTIYNLNVSTKEEVDLMRANMASTKEWAYYKDIALSSLSIEPYYPILFKRRPGTDEKDMSVKRPMLILKYQVDPKHEAAFDEWYASYMDRFMARVPEMVTGARFVAETNGIKHFLSVYEIESEDKIEAAMANIVQDTPERIKDSEEWHHWEHIALSSLDDAVFTCMQLEDKDSIKNF